MTQGQLAEAIGCRVKDISRWENGHVEPGVLTVKKIAQVLGCSMMSCKGEKHEQREGTV